MAVNEETLTPEITLTEKAAQEIKALLEEQGKADAALRVWVAGGGCSGFQYEYNLVKEEPTADDLVLHKDEATVLIDSMSRDFCLGDHRKKR